MDIVQWLLTLIDMGQLQVLAYLIGANLLLGIVTALKVGSFELVKLQEFWRRVAIVFGAYLVVAIAAKGLSDFEVLRTAAWLALLAYLGAQIVGNLKDLGIPIPDGVMKYIERTP